MHRLPALSALCLAVPLALAARPASAAFTYPDSTIVDRFTLPSGLRVVTRHVPLASSVVMTACFQGGSADDPAGREGWAHLLGEVAFTAEAGDVPVRTRTELGSQRPLGFGVRVLPRVTQLTEIAAYAQFPGVLHQVAQRLRGTKPDQPVLTEALTQVRQELTRQYGATPVRLMQFGASDLAGDGGAQGLLRFASAQGLAKVSLGEVQSAVSRRFAPSNAVLAIVGNLYAYDVRGLLERELAGLPAAKSAPAIAWSRRDSAWVMLARPGLAKPTGVMGVIAPALTDTLHPMFFAHTVLLGSFVNTAWPNPEPPVTNRFQYSVADDPEVARFYPPVTYSDPPRVDEEFAYAARGYFGAEVDSATYDRMAIGVAWLVGGPVPRDVLLRMKRDPSALGTLASSMAARERYADEEFWLGYRRRLASRRGPSESWWVGYFSDPSRQVQLVLTPGAP